MNLKFNLLFNDPFVLKNYNFSGNKGSTTDGMDNPLPILAPLYTKAAAQRTVVFGEDLRGKEVSSTFNFTFLFYRMCI